MGDINQRLLLERALPAVEGPVLEVGSRDYGSTASFRSLYFANEYIGVDLDDGAGVDVVCDLTTGPGPLQTDYFALVICCSVLEHTPTPWKLADTITTLLRPGGIAFISVPWVWRYHAYPDDYYRFSYSGLRHVFSALEWYQAWYTTTVEGEIYPITEQDPSADTRLGITKSLSGERNRAYLPYLLVNGLARKPKRE